MKIFGFLLVATAQAFDPVIPVQCGEELTQQQREHCEVGNTIFSDY